MRIRVAATVAAAALAIAGAGYLFDWWQHRPIVGVVSGPDSPEYGSQIGIGTQDLDKKALQEAKTGEDFKNVPGLRFDTAAPTPSAWRP